MQEDRAISGAVHSTLRARGALPMTYVDGQHLVPKVGQADGVCEPEVARPDHGHARQLTISSRRTSLRFLVRLALFMLTL